jgi:uncharacterized protein YuzE
MGTTALKKPNLQGILNMIPSFVAAPYSRLWTSSDHEADVLYINFKKPSHADDSEMTDDNIIVRYEGNKIVGLTVLNASKRKIRKAG